MTITEPGEHAVQNVGERDLHMFALETIQPAGGATGASSAAKGMTVVGESSSFRAYDAKLADDNSQISHVHTAPALTILIEGRVLSQGPETKDKALGEVASGLKQLDQPGQWVFVPAGEPHYLVRLGSEQPHIVEVELR